MLGWNASKAQGLYLALLPPISLRHLPSSVGSQERSYPQWCEPRNRGIARGDARDCRGIEVIIVVVGENHGVNRRQAVEVHSWRNPAPGTDELQRRGALAPDGVDENVEPRDLEQERCMSDPRHRELFR